MGKVVVFLLLFAFTASPAMARTLKVDCSSSKQTISSAVTSAQPGDTIQIRGVCNEALNIQTDALTLDGLGSAIIDGTGLNQTVITVTGAGRVVIQNLTVQNGVDGIVVTKQASVTLAGLQAKGNTRMGIRIDNNSAAALKNCTVQGSGNDGIVVVQSSNATFEGIIISQGNNGDGIGIYGSSNGIFLPGSTITAISNQGKGITVGGASSLSASTGTINASSNTDPGIFIDHSSFEFNSTVLVQNNQSWGVQLGHATVKVGGALTASGNQEDGLGIFAHSFFWIGGDATVTVTQNARHGINLYTSSSLSNLSGGTLVIQNNPDTGLAISDGSSARLLNGRTTITGNTQAGLGLWRGARVELAGNNVIDKISTDNTVLINGVLQNQPPPPPPPVRTVAVCVNAGVDSVGGCSIGSCSCNGLANTVSKVYGMFCTATSDTGSCTASGCGGASGSCCVCIAQ